MVSTIAAIATPSGPGALGIVRVSGPKSIEIVDQIFKGKKLDQQKGFTLHFGEIVGEKKKIDEVLVGLFRKPKSYTGENMVEISCHGSPFILREIIELLIKKGAQPAQAGEFTERAYLNGKLDLSQAEAVADLIASENEASHRLAFQQLKGGISSEIDLLRDELIQFASLLELELDFGEEDVEFADRKKLSKLVMDLQKLIQSLVESFKTGQAIKEGIPTALVGRPNAGKSTLLNSLVKDNRSIVSDVPGTTRDTIEDFYEVKGIKFRLIDTAGIRKTSELVESLGIERTFLNIEKAGVVIYLYDAKELGKEALQKDIRLIQEKNASCQLWIVQNKIDLVSKPSPHLTISAKNGQIKSLEDTFRQYAESLNIGDQTIITNVRHHYELTHSQTYLNNVQKGLEIGLSHDLLAFEIRCALKHLGNITGAIDIDKDILGNIFGQFCIGK